VRNQQRQERLFGVFDRLLRAHTFSTRFSCEFGVIGLNQIARLGQIALELGQPCGERDDAQESVMLAAKRRQALRVGCGG
jgi:hypothetical protein